MRMGVDTPAMGAVLAVSELLIFMLPFNVMTYLPNFFFAALCIWIGFDILKVRPGMGDESGKEGCLLLPGKSFKCVGGHSPSPLLLIHPPLPLPLRAQDWVYVAAKRLGVLSLEYGLLLGTLGAIVVWGLEVGIVAGIVAAAASFAYRCRRGREGGVQHAVAAAAGVAGSLWRRCCCSGRGRHSARGACTSFGSAMLMLRSPAPPPLAPPR